MSYARMREKEEAPKAEGEKLLEEAALTDAEEDVKYGQGKRGGELARRPPRTSMVLHPGS